MKKLLTVATTLLTSSAFAALPPSNPPDLSHVVTQASYYECARDQVMDVYVEEVDHIFVCDDMLVVNSRVHFDFDKSNIDDEAAMKLIDFTRKLLMDSPSVKVTVIGHTDAVGTKEYNEGLGMRRAKAVADYLRNKGVNVVDVVSKGETQLIENTQGKSRTNRRADSTVEISLM